MLTTAQELQEKTQAFWRISQAWNNRSNENISFEVAVGTLNDTIYGSNPARPIIKQAFMLREELILDKGRKPRKKATPPTPLRKQQPA